MRFYGVNGEPVLSKKTGYHGWEAEYDEQGNKTVETYLGLDGKPTTIADGYATLKSIYDSRGNVIRRASTALTANRSYPRRMVTTGGRQSTTRQATTVVTYLGPTAIADGYATLKSTYDQAAK